MPIACDAATAIECIAPSIRTSASCVRCWPMISSRAFCSRRTAGISRPKSIVLDRSSYREVMARQLGYRAFAHHVLARFSALIVGFGLSDPDFEDLLQSFETNFGGGVGEHVYIWKRGQRQDEEARALVLRRRYGLVCIFVDSFDDVRTVISDARTHMGKQLRHTIAMTLKRSADVEEFRSYGAKPTSSWVD